MHPGAIVAIGRIHTGGKSHPPLEKPSLNLRNSYALGAGSFHGYRAVASLKHVLEFTQEKHGLAFHGYRAVAQLKRNPEVAVDDHRVGGFLRLKSPGFIEGRRRVLGSAAFGAASIDVSEN